MKIAFLKWKLIIIIFCYNNLKKIKNIKIYNDFYNYLIKYKFYNYFLIK